MPSIKVRWAKKKAMTTGMVNDHRGGHHLVPDDLMLGLIILQAQSQGEMFRVVQVEQRFRKRFQAHRKVKTVMVANTGLDSGKTMFRKI